MSPKRTWLEIRLLLISGQDSTGLIPKLYEGQEKQIYSPLSENESKLFLTQSLGGVSPRLDSHSTHALQPKGDLYAACLLFHTHNLSFPQSHFEVEPDMSESVFPCHLALSSS